MSQVDSNFDDIFSEIAGRSGGLVPLFNSFFGFLARRTDFYVEADPNEPAPMGFPPGTAKKMLVSAFENHAFINYKDTPQYRNRSSSPAHSPAAIKGANRSPTPSTPNTSNKTIQTSCDSASSSRNAEVVEPLRNGENTKTPQKKSAENATSNGLALQTPLGNGGIGLGYYWTQTLTEVTVFVDAEMGAFINFYFYRNSC